jgi:SRSO17 transposase
VAVRLYLPQDWPEDSERLRRARVPADVTFQTKPQIALALLDQARAWGVPHHGIVAEADYGDNPHFLAGLEDRNEHDVVAIRCDLQVRPKGRGARPSQRADQVWAALPRRQWRTIRWRHGTKGWWRKKFVAVRVWRGTAEGEAHIGWLVGERAARGQPEEHKYYWRNLSASATLEELVDYAHRRDAIEQFHEEAKEELGWDQYQGRLWPGFHRHAVTVMLALSFLLWLELRQRHRHPKRGRPRDPFSPSAGSMASCAPGCASRGGPVATTPSDTLVGIHRSIHGTLLTQDLTK